MQEISKGIFPEAINAAEKFGQADQKIITPIGDKNFIFVDCGHTISFMIINQSGKVTSHGSFTKFGAKFKKEY